jgi:quercetin dioxygenase-like cupin family protein
MTIKQIRSDMTRCLCVAMWAALIVTTNAMGEQEMKNVLTDIPYTEGQMGKRQLVDEKHLLVMQVALKPDQQVPEHRANSNVHLLVVEGQITVTLAGQDLVAAKGALVPVAFKTLMSIRNASTDNASFLILKTPNPSEMAR